MKISTLRKLLTDNKIFFEVGVASLLSFMAIYISIQANRIAEVQTTIMEQENIPQLEIRMFQDYNDETKLYDNNVWHFYNRGGSISEFETQNYTFFKFKHGPNFNELVLPIYNYFNMTGILSGDSQGLIYRIDNDHNNIKEIELRDSLKNHGYFEIESYKSISYTDIFDKKHVEYFKINPMISKISEEEWKSLDKQFNSAPNRHTFKQLYASDIIHKLKTPHSISK